MFHSNRGGNWGKYTIETDGFNLTDHPAVEGHARLVARRTQIVLDSDRSGTILTNLINADGAAVSLLTAPPTGSEAIWPDW